MEHYTLVKKRNKLRLCITACHSYTDSQEATWYDTIWICVTEVSTVATDRQLFCCNKCCGQGHFIEGKVHSGLWFQWVEPIMAGRHGSRWEEWWQGQETESSYSQLPAWGRKWKLEVAPGFQSQTPPQCYTSSIKTVPAKPPQTASPTSNHMLRSLRWRRIALIQTTAEGLC